MKWLMTVLVLVAVTGGVSAAEFSGNWSHTIVAADTVGYGVGGAVNNYDTTIAGPFRIEELPVGTKFLWFTAAITDRDTTLLNDTLNVIFQWSTNGRTWTFFDSLLINTTSTNDTLIYEGTRMKLDSATGYYVNQIRALMVNRYDIVQGDTLIVGNTYKQNQSIWVHPRF